MRDKKAMNNEVGNEIGRSRTNWIDTISFAGEAQLENSAYDQCYCLMLSVNVVPVLDGQASRMVPVLPVLEGQDNSNVNETGNVLPVLRAQPVREPLAACPINDKTPHFLSSNVIDDAPLCRACVGRDRPCVRTQFFIQ